MNKTAIESALDDIYTSLNNNNDKIDLHIAALKNALGTEKTVTVDPSRLIYRNRSGRKLMQAYFKKRGIIVTFLDNKSSDGAELL